HVALPSSLSFLFFTATPTPEIYTLSLHDALPICQPLHRLLRQSDPDLHHPFGGAESAGRIRRPARLRQRRDVRDRRLWGGPGARSEEHTSELQSRENLVCRLLLEKKKI